jgi:hypothetical protein
MLTKTTTRTINSSRTFPSAPAGGLALRSYGLTAFRLGRPGRVTALMNYLLAAPGRASLPYGAKPRREARPPRGVQPDEGSPAPPGGMLDERLAPLPGPCAAWEPCTQDRAPRPKRARRPDRRGDDLHL